jgi:hypothetical protein
MYLFPPVSVRAPHEAAAITRLTRMTMRAQALAVLFVIWLAYASVRRPEDFGNSFLERRLSS